MSTSRFLFSNGILLHSPDAPAVKDLLEAHPGTFFKMSKILILKTLFVFKYDFILQLIFYLGAYTTSRTHNNGSYLLFWERHMKRLPQSIQTLSHLAPQFLFKPEKSIASLPSSVNLPIWQPTVQMLVNDSMCKVLPIALKEKNDGEELAITTLVSGNLEELNARKTMEYEERLCKALEVHVHVDAYVPSSFGVRENGAHLALVGRGRDVAAAKYSDWVK